MKTFKSIVKKLKDPKIIAGIAIVAVAIGISVWLIRRHREKKEGYTNAELACFNTCKSVGPNHSPARTACRNRCKASGGGSSSHTAHGWVPGGCPVGQVLVAGKCMWNPITAAAGGSSHVASGWTQGSCAAAGCRWDATTNKCAPGPGQTYSKTFKKCLTSAQHLSADRCRVACIKAGKCKAGNSSWNRGLCCDQPWSSQKGCVRPDGGPSPPATKMMTPGKYWCTINGTPVTSIDTTKYPGTDATWACNTWRPKQCAGKCTTVYPFGAMR